MVEGGIQTLQQFITLELWDETRVLTAPKYLASGRTAPALPVPPSFSEQIGDDRLELFYRSTIR
jgi:diaminohydroxyphosphoribosylaminopyrimidine deaminase/5-amino-6-(5-phosphoribosylamino)uracil reductase